MASLKKSKVAKEQKTEKRKVPESKIKAVKELAKLIDSNSTIMFASIKGLPAKNFQKIKKSLSDRSEIKVVKKRMLSKAIEESKKENILLLKDFIKEDIAFISSNIDAFELSATLSDSKSSVKAKAGQESNIDIEVEAGPTDLPAGPAVSELGALGLQVQVKDGKIEIRNPKVIVKKGQIISEGAASVMGKLNIMPFYVGFIPLVAYDSNSKSIFTELTMDKLATIELIKSMFAKSRTFAVSLNYLSKETLSMLFAKAASHERALNSFIKLEETNSADLGEKNGQ